MELKGVLPAIRKMKDFERVLESDMEHIIFLDTRISQLHRLVQLAKQANKKILIHADLVSGLKVDQYGMEYLIREVKVDGVISTRNSVVSLAKKNNIIAIQRLFALDSLALQNNIKLVRQSKPDYIEVLPGIIPSVIKEVSIATEVPIIAGGLIRNRDQIDKVLASGAVAITTSNNELW